MFTPEQLEQISSAEFERDFQFEIPDRNDGDSLWQDITNLRAQRKGRYVFARPRGGTSVLFDITGETIFNFESLQVNIGDGQERYIAALTESGKIFLVDVDSPATVNEITSGFSGSEPVQFVNNGRFIYMFEYGGNTRKYYDITEDQVYNFDSHERSSILSASFFSGALRENNVWGIEDGNTVIVFPDKLRGSSEFISSSRIDFTPFITRINTTRNNTFRYNNKDLFSDSQTAGFGEGSDSFLPYNDDLEDMLGRGGRFEYKGGQVAPNDEYQRSTIYRAYVVVDMLNDGTVSIPGRPFVVSTNEREISQNGYTGVNVEVSAADSNVEKRFLCSTRWQYSQQRALSPSNSRYPNSAFFINTEIETSSYTVKDVRGDELLIRPISEILPIRSGVPLLFESGAVSFNTVAPFKGSLIAGNYTSKRPTPDIYTGAGSGNTHVNVESGNSLTDSPVIAAAFEYTDGKKSEIVDGSTVLTDAEKEVIIREESQATLTIDIEENNISDGEITYQIDIDGNLSDEFTILDSDSLMQITSKINNALNTTAITNVWDIGSGTTSITLIHKAHGTTGNGKSFSYNFISGSGTIDEFDVVLTSNSPSSGGADELSEMRKVNSVSVHSLNIQVSKVNVLIKRGSSYKLFSEVLPSDAEFCGAELLLPNSDSEINELPDFSSYSSNSSIVREEVTVPNGLLLSTPFQEFRIDQQYSTDGEKAIRKIVPIQFDSDRSSLRYTLFVATTGDIQLGYISGFGDSFDAQFETVQQGITPINYKWLRRVSNQIFIQTQKGVFLFSRSGMQTIVDSDRYPAAKATLRSVGYNNIHDEFWMAFDDSTVLAHRVGGAVYKMEYPSAVRGVDFNFENMVLSIGGNICYTDLDSSHKDNIGSETDIMCSLISGPIGDEINQTRLFEYLLYGQDVEAELSIDFQPQRYQGNSPAGWDTDFTPDVTFSKKDLVMSGAQWVINGRGIMPRVRIEATPKSVSAIISKGVLKGYITSNKNISMK